VGVAAQATSALNPALAVTGHGLRARLAFTLAHRAAAAGLGLASTLLLLVPVLGVLAIPAAIVGASELVARALREGPPARR
jgi:uncharacterized protein involved in cysteine biosynthesis